MNKTDLRDQPRSGKTQTQARLLPPPSRSDAGSSEGLCSRYGFPGMIRLIRDFLLTKLSVPGARILRWPWYIRGFRHIRFGSGFTAGVGLRLDAFSEEKDRICIHIGSRVEMNDYVHIGSVYSVTIGDDVLIASRVFITDHDHGCYGGSGPHSSPETRPADRDLRVSPVCIGNRAWLGEGVTILPGVTIGAGAVIGANAVVTQDIPEHCLAVGTPARVIKRYDSTIGQWARAENTDIPH